MADEANAPTTYNVLFVCTGNTCRSPFAEQAMREAVERRGWHHVRVDSAGVAADWDAPASENAIRVAGEVGLDLTGHRSQPLTPELVAWADIILAMSRSHLDAVDELGGAEKAALLAEFAAGAAQGGSIDDPFGGDLPPYRRAFAQIESAIAGVLRKLEPILSP